MNTPYFKMAECLYENLYLAKDSLDSNKDIYVKKCPLIQHQLDGIRFLYRAYKKKTPGVILNDPSGYGKRVQTALFLSAILPTLDRPVLILCRKGSEQGWLDNFREWTQVCNDVAIELTNPFCKKKVLISPSYSAVAFARGDWSLLVVDDCLSKDLLKAPLRAGLRIWITSANVKVDLFLYSTFHTWLHPKDKFNADKYIPNAQDLRDVFAKTVMLDAFLEDTVLRRSYDEPPFRTTQVPIQTEIRQIRVTKKNKDATGTKIKRTKRKSVDTNTLVVKEDTPRKVAKTGTATDGKHNESKLNSVKESRNSEEDPKDSFAVGYDSISENYTQLRYKRNKSRAIWDSDSGSEDDNGTKQKKYNKINTNESQQIFLQYDSELESESNKDRVIVSKSNQLEEAMRNDSVADENISHDKLENVKDNKNLSECDNITNESKKNTLIHEIAEENEVKSKNIKLGTNLFANASDEDSGSLLINEEIPNAMLKNDDTNDELHILSVNNEVKKDRDVSEDLFLTDWPDNKVTVNEIKEITEDVGLNQNTKDNDNEKTEQKPGKSLSSFELKLKQFEEQALKKYSGSFLDSLF